MIVYFCLANFSCPLCGWLFFMLCLESRLGFDHDWTVDIRFMISGIHVHVIVCATIHDGEEQATVTAQLYICRLTHTMNDCV